MQDSDTELKLIGQRIRNVRIKRKMTQADLAYAADLSLSHISDIELGKKEMHIPTFVKIIEALQISADYILRPNVPEVNAIYNKEFSTLLKDCSSTEIEAIMTIVKQVKTTLRAKKED
jgi:transcriptional regulator with XRE-family HTH domain